MVCTVILISGDGTATATAAMAAPLFTAEINNSLVINYNCNLDRVSAAGVQLPLVKSSTSVYPIVHAGTISSETE